MLPILLPAAGVVAAADGLRCTDARFIGTLDNKDFLARVFSSLKTRAHIESVQRL